MGTESEGDVSDQVSLSRPGTESDDWFFHSDSESEPAILASLSLVDPNNAGFASQQADIRAQLGTEPLHHLTRESISTQALWQITGGSSSVNNFEGETEEEKIAVACDTHSYTVGVSTDSPGNIDKIEDESMDTETLIEENSAMAAKAPAKSTRKQLFDATEGDLSDQISVDDKQRVDAVQGNFQVQNDIEQQSAVSVPSNHREANLGTLKRGLGSTTWNSQNEVMLENPNSFGSSVSKSFFCEICGHMSNTAICIPKFQIVRNAKDGPKRGEQHAEFLVVVELGAFTFGVWRRYTDFVYLAESIMATDEQKAVYPNSIFSWQCLRFRKRWYKCLDKDYLTVKCFLLERFLHDLVCESTNPTTIFDFIGV